MRPKSDAIAWRDAVTKEAQQRREDWERLEAQRKRLEELRGERNASASARPTLTTCKATRPAKDGSDNK